MWEGAGKVCRSCMQVRGLCDVDLGVLNEEAGKWEYNMCVDRSPGANRAPIRNSDCFFNNHDLVPIQNLCGLGWEDVSSAIPPVSSVDSPEEAADMQNIVIWTTPLA